VDPVAAMLTEELRQAVVEEHATLGPLARV
jgi:hypothetical protein